MARVKLVDVIDEYYRSLDYRALAPKTQRDYKYCLEALLNTTARGKSIRSMYIESLNPPYAQAAYNKWAEKGIPTANHIQAVASKLYNYAIQLGYTPTNPFSTISKKAHRARKVVWTKDHVKKFLDTAYSQFKWRSVGLIVQMAYEWCQRLGDMANLKWENYDAENRVLYLEQSKRRAKVELPTTNELHEMLMQQKADVDFQPYIAPQCGTNRIYPRPYKPSVLSQIGRQIIKAAGLPNELQIMDMRRTGTVEMVDAGVPLPQILSVTGHQSPKSITPYLKNTLTSARKAATLRFNTAGDTVIND